MSHLLADGYGFGLEIEKLDHGVEAYFHKDGHLYAGGDVDVLPAICRAAILVKMGAK